jgi:tryptophan synthase alpha chain
MSVIENKFKELRRRGRKAFVPFVTAGDPDLETSRGVVLTLIDAGADIIELGVPFSDPMADGPTIQASSLRALSNGTTLCDVLELVREIRAVSEVPIVLFSYLNPLFRYGIGRLAKEAQTAGVDGVLITDAVDGEALEIAEILALKGIDLISLIAPTTSDVRLEKIAERSRGFLYAVSRAGVTGAQSQASSTAQSLVERARGFTDRPIAVGFGISTREQIEDVWRYADGAVVGSAIVNVIERSIAMGNTVEMVANFTRELLPQVAKDARET